MEIIYNECWFSGELNGVNYSKDDLGIEYLNIEFEEHEPQLNLCLSKKDLNYLLERLTTMKNEGLFNE